MRAVGIKQNFAGFSGFQKRKCFGEIFQWQAFFEERLQIQPAMLQKFRHLHPGLEMCIRDSSKEVRNGLQKLPDRARMALVLRYFAEMSYDEIADTLGVRRAFVGVLLLRARHQLRDVLAGNDAPLIRGAAGGKV